MGRSKYHPDKVRRKFVLCAYAQRFNGTLRMSTPTMWDNLWYNCIAGLATPL